MVSCRPAGSLRDSHNRASFHIRDYKPQLIGKIIFWLSRETHYLKVGAFTHLKDTLQASASCISHWPLVYVRTPEQYFICVKKERRGEKKRLKKQFPSSYCNAVSPGNSSKEEVSSLCLLENRRGLELEHKSFKTTKIAWYLGLLVFLRGKATPIYAKQHCTMS